MASTKEVLDHHLKCFAEQDMQGALSDYSPDAVVLTPFGAIKGHEAMKPGLQALLDEFGKPGASITVKQQCIEGDYAYLVWSAETPDNLYEIGSDTFHVKDGKIVAQSYIFKVTPKSGR